MSACNTYNSNLLTNTNLCNNELCSVMGSTNTCQSGCCTGAYCRDSGSCATATWLPITFAVLLLAWLIFTVVVAYRAAAAKREQLLGLKGQQQPSGASSAVSSSYETQVTLNVQDH